MVVRAIDKPKCEKCLKFVKVLAYVPRQPCALLDEDGKWVVELGFTREEIPNKGRYIAARDAVCNAIFPGLPAVPDFNDSGLYGLMTARLEQIIQDSINPKALRLHSSKATEDSYARYKARAQQKARAEIFMEDFETICEFLDYDVDEMRAKIIQMWCDPDAKWDKRRPNAGRR